MGTLQFDLLSFAFHTASSSVRSFASLPSLPRAAALRLLSPRLSSPPSSPLRLNAFSTDAADAIIKVPDKPSICTADELHYVSVSNSDWRLALWRYHPCPKAPRRNRPLLLLSGVGTNAIGYDLCTTESSFARYMSGQGFETWILEVRGAGLSVQGSNSKDIEQSALAKSEKMEAASESATNGAFPSEQKLNNISCAMSESDISDSEEKEPQNLAFEGDLTGLATVWDESKLVARLTETLMSLSERFSGFLSESQSKVMSTKLLDQISKLLVDSPFLERFNEIRGKLSTLLETRQNSGVTSQITDLSEKLVNIIEEGQRSLSPRFFNLQERFTSTLEDFQKQIDLMVKYDWDFDHYLEEDVPAAIDYILRESKPKDGKLLAIGHSMGGILLYAMLSRFGFEGKEPRLAAVVTLASSLDYTSSKSTLKLLLPLADPAQALNVPVVPLGAMLAAAYPLSSRPPYVLSWLNNLISAEDMMDPELLKKLVLSNFCTIPAKLILQLTTAFREGGLCNRDGTFLYKDHLHKSSVPVLAVAGDQDLICPPEAVQETVKLIPQHLVTYKVFGEPGGPHYAHYDLVGGRLAVKEVYPCIIEFLSRHDK
ncbi:putative peptidase S9, serine active, alpha/Beta hydrolase [Senna tora]|uniref:Putative peptidase S9, serine active, alpha/Beta hydrolase n=1 Tax=Senna tora TaxID=362788 RepID=A0A834TWE9_9FABA|nr:putative peptidase S9, serine active, alpha/Beta hydrolase [Senna tora]